MKPLVAALCLAALTVCGFSPIPANAADHSADRHVNAWTAVRSAVAVLNSTSGSRCKGTVKFFQEGDVVKVVADVEGLNPGQKHAFHIHQFGDATSVDGMSTGGHYNPENHPHGLPEADHRHAGDLGNLQGDANGKVHYEIIVKNISVAGLKNPIIGRGVIVHAKMDDGGQPVGNAGPRIACGVIGVANAGVPAAAPAPAAPAK